MEELLTLVAHAGHTVVGVAKQYDERTAPPISHVDLIVAAGGDGTVATVATLASASSVPLAILPLGTANNVARTVGFREDGTEIVGLRSVNNDLDFGLVRAKLNFKF